MSLVFWDTNLFVYLVEENPEFCPQVEAIRTRMLRRADRLCTSALTIGETLTGALLRGDEPLAQQYRNILHPPTIEILEFTSDTAEHYARIRTDVAIRRPDALQLACAAEAGVDLFLTNDRRLLGHDVRGIQFIAGLENCPI